MEWSNEVTMEFLDLYEGEPCIWNPRNADHKDRHLVYDAWKRIQDHMSVQCSFNELKKKKENLMATYRKLAAKVKNSTKTGSGAKEVYKPEWFAYEKMASFLHSIYTPRNTKTSDEQERPVDEQFDSSSSIHETPDTFESSEIINEAGHTAPTGDTAASEVDLPDQRGSPTNRKRKKAEQTAQTDHRIDEAYSLLNQVAKKPKATKDESSLFCELLCVKLRALDEGNRQLAMHQINNIMFEFVKPNIQPYWSSENYSPHQHIYPHGQGVKQHDSSADDSSNASSDYND